jgi:Tol biopolymer transport system component
MCLVSFGIGWRLHTTPVTPPAWKISQLTVDAGLSDASALSRDGKLVAYSSDRGLEDGRDLYVKQVSGGQPIRLTSDGAGNTTPDFSPDGSKIVFRSNRDGGGIYEIPTFGGQARLLAKHGMNPRFSPDGSQVAYWVGSVNVVATIPGNGEVWVISAAGGQPRRIDANFTNARYPIWSPDGKQLLLVGYTSEKLSDSSSLDWWRVPINGDPPTKTGLYDALSHPDLPSHDIPFTPSATYPNVPTPGCWLAGTNSLIFSARNGDTQNLWETGFSPRTGMVSGTFRRLTAGAGNEREPSCVSEDALTFTNVETKTGIWTVPFDFDQGRSKGALEPITLGTSDQEPSLSRDGRYLAFASEREGPLNIWLRDLETSKEQHIASSSDAQRFPVINASGDKIAYSAFEAGHRSVYMWTSGGAPEKMCEGCLRATDWSGDEKTLITFGGTPYQIDALDIASRQRTPILKHPTYNLLYGRLSRDNRWISFTARTQPNRAMIMIAPLDGTKAIPQSAWIKIAEEEPDHWADWSPDGKTLYFASARDGHTCLWGQRLEAVSHRPVGEAFAVQHFHGRLSYRAGGWSPGDERIAVGLVDSRENIWMMSRPSSR